MGSDDHFHYFIDRKDDNADRRLKVGKETLVISGEFKYGESALFITPYVDEVKEDLFTVAGVKYRRPPVPLFSIDGVNYYGIKTK